MQANAPAPTTNALAPQARKLVDLYFTLFEQTVRDHSGKKQNSSMVSAALALCMLVCDIGTSIPQATRFLSALLTGVNRTCPYVSAACQHSKDLFRKTRLCCLLLGLCVCQVSSGSAEDGETSVATMLDDRVDTLFKLIHVGTFMTSTQV